MSMGSWVKACGSITGNCGLSKNALVKWDTSIPVECQALGKFLDKMQSNVYGKLDESLLFNLSEKCGLSKNALVESDTFISVESAGSQKIP